MVNHRIEPLRHVEVGMGEWTIGDADTLLDTRGLTWCTGVAVYDPVQHVGHLMHSVGPLVQQEMVETFFESAERMASEPERLKLWVRGNSVLSGSRLLKDAAKNRAYVEAMARAVGIAEPNTDIRWGDNSIDMVLDCSDGRFVEGHTVYRETIAEQPIGARYLLARARGEEFLDDTQQAAANLLRILAADQR